jgi:hypothetical protein
MAKDGPKPSQRRLRKRPEPTPESTSPSPAPSRWRRRLLIGLVLLVALVGLAPMLATLSPVRNGLLAWATSGIQGSVSVGNLSLGWFSPITASDVTLSDAAGTPLVRVPSVAGEKSLVDFFWSRGDLGKFTLQGLQVDLVLRDDGSNLEDALAAWLKPKEQAVEGVDLELDVTDATVNIRSATTGEQWAMQQLALTLKLPRLATSALELNLTSSVAQRDASGPLSVKLTMRDAAAADGQAIKVGHVSVRAEQFPLALCQPFLRRAAPRSQLAGRLDADLSVDWGLDQAGQTRRIVSGQVSARQLMAAGPWFGADALRLARVDLPCQITWEGNQLLVNRLVATCDVGQISCQGSISNADRLLGGATTWQAIRTIGHGTTEIAGQIDLARLAQLLPQTLRVRGDTQLTSGLLNLQLSSRAQGEASVWQGRLEASRLAALHEGREVTWNQPLLVTLAAQDSPAGLVVDRVRCVSDFLQLDGSGKAEAFQLSGNFDLNRLATELSKFVKLDNLRLAGQGTTSLNWSAQPDGSLAAGGALKVNRFELATAGSPVWSDEQLVLAGSTTLARAGNGALGVKSAQASLTAGSDTCSLTLTSPVAPPLVAASWPANLNLEGNIAAWRTRLAPWLGALTSWEAAGQAKLSAAVKGSVAGVDLERSDLTIQNLQLRGPGLLINEPAARLRVAGAWSTTPARVAVREAIFDTSALTAQLRDAVLTWVRGAMTDASAKLSYEGDLAKLQAWFTDPAAVTNWNLAGALKGRGNVTSAGNKISGQLDTTIENLLATPRTGRQWREPSVSLTAAASLDRSTDTLEIEQLAFVSDLAEVRATGKVLELATRRSLEASGELKYDLEKLTRVLQSYNGPAMQLAGRESRAFSVSGSLAAWSDPGANNRALAVAERLTAHIDLGWQWANAYGIRLNGGVLETDLSGGLLQTKPLTLAINGGKLHVAPQVRLSQNAADLVLPAGPLVEQVEITPEMCNSGLKFVAPVLAEVAQAQGRFSVALDSCRVPMDSPATADVSGRLTIHSVEITPGPLVSEMAAVLGRNAPARLTKESQVLFRMVQGRIYHQGLELVFPDFSIRTQGSVGLDQSLSLLAEMPVPVGWIGNNPQLAATLKGQTIRVPIGGTLSRPQVDRQAFEQMAAQFIRSATEGTLLKEVNRGLDRLFSPMSPGSK